MPGEESKTQICALVSQDQALEMLNVGRRSSTPTAQVGQATYAETPPSLAMVDTPVALYGAAIRLTSQR